LRGLVLNFASTHQTENPRGFSEVGENKQLLIAIVGKSFLFYYFLGDTFFVEVFFEVTLLFTELFFDSVLFFSI
jgi:hypothetical protein